MDEGVLFRTNGNVFDQIKRKLINECDLWFIVNLQPKFFVYAGVNSKANLFFLPRESQPKKSDCRISDKFLYVHHIL